VNEYVQAHESNTATVQDRMTAARSTVISLVQSPQNLKEPLGSQIGMHASVAASSALRPAAFEELRLRQLCAPAQLSHCAT